MTGRGWAPALLEIFPIQTWRGQDLNDGQGVALHPILFSFSLKLSYSNLAWPGFE